jgi:hypothetical protein
MIIPDPVPTEPKNSYGSTTPPKIIYFCLSLLQEGVKPSCEETVPSCETIHVAIVCAGNQFSPVGLVD